MKEISSDKIKDCVKRLLLKAANCPPDDVLSALSTAQKSEESEVGKHILESLLENAVTAKETGLPYCQDTGLALVFLEIGQDVHIAGSIGDAVNEAVKEAYVNLRKSVLDPLSRVNTGDNTPAIIHYTLTTGDKMKITVAPKGFGSENMSALKMLNPSDGAEGIVRFVTDCVKKAGSSPCPPVILGIGIGGSFEKCAYMAKHALLREVGSTNSDAQLNDFENTLKQKINEIGLGPMGLGGTNYCLAVHIETYPTHIAGLPVAVNFQCHAARHESEEL